MSWVMAQEVHLLPSLGWESGWSGESWFKADRTGVEWQAYVVAGDREVTFVPQDTRESMNLFWEDFEDLFNA